MKRRKKPWENDDDIFRIFEELEREIFRELEEMFRAFDRISPEEFSKPVVYGFSVRIGPDGRPIVRSFGNVRGGEILAYREPLTNVLPMEDTIVVTFELPGVEKDKIRVEATEEKLFLEAESETGEKYKKIVEFPEPVDPKSYKATFKNGILEITFKKKEGPREKIKIS